MADLPTVSVVIPTYNYARYLPRAVRSVLAQEYPSVEIVIVDDGSTDDTDSVVTEFDDQVRYIKQANQGLAGARNTGIRESKGDLLFFLDADDEMHPDTLRKMHALIESSGEDTGLIACEAQVIHWNGDTATPAEMVEFAPGTPPTEITWQDLAIGNRFPCTVLARRSVFERCGDFDASYRQFGCEDRDMWLRTACRFRILRLQERLVTLHLHGSNMSMDPARQLAGIDKLLRKAKTMPVVPRWRIDFWGALLSIYHYTASILYAEANQSGLAFRHALLSWLVYPLPGVQKYTRRGPFFRLRRMVATARTRFLKSGTTD